MGDPTNDTVSPWQPMSRPIDQKHIGKLLEELGEAVTAAVRFDLNIQHLENELADVQANLLLCCEHFNLRIVSRPLPQSSRMEALLTSLGHATAAAARCLIQGIDETEPTTGKCNKEWLTETVSDLAAAITAVTAHWRFDTTRMRERTKRKMENLSRWHQALD